MALIIKYFTAFSPSQSASFYRLKAMASSTNRIRPCTQFFSKSSPTHLTFSFPTHVPEDPLCPNYTNSPHWTHTYLPFFSCNFPYWDSILPLFIWQIFKNRLKVLKATSSLYLALKCSGKNNAPSNLIISLKLWVSCWQVSCLNYSGVAETQEKLGTCGPLNRISFS